MHLLTSKGGANRRQAESNHACMNCRGAKEENKRSAVKNRRGETISGSATAPALNRMPSALLKQSKDFRFLTLRRRGRLSSEIASAAGWADACEYCSSSELRGPQPPDSGGPQRHSHRCVLRRLRPEYRTHCNRTGFFYFGEMSYLCFREQCN